MKEVIKKTYAKELDLVADTPSAIRMKWTDYLARITDKVWDSQSIAMMALFMACLSARVYYYNYFTVEYCKTRLEITS